MTLAIENELKTLESKYRLVDGEEVFAFLNENPFLIKLLLEARPEIEIYFPGCPVYIQFQVDPEIGNEMLLAFISPDIYDVEEAFEKFQQFLHNWWLKHNREADEKLLFIPEYR